MCRAGVYIISNMTMSFEIGDVTLSPSTCAKQPLVHQSETREASLCFCRRSCSSLRGFGIINWLTQISEAKQQHYQKIIELAHWTGKNSKFDEQVMNFLERSDPNKFPTLLGIRFWRQMLGYTVLSRKVVGKCFCSTDNKQNCVCKMSELPQGTLFTILSFLVPVHDQPEKVLRVLRLERRSPENIPVNAPYQTYDYLVMYKRGVDFCTDGRLVQTEPGGHIGVSVLSNQDPLSIAQWPTTILLVEKGMFRGNISAVDTSYSVEFTRNETDETVLKVLLDSRVLRISSFNGQPRVFEEIGRVGQCWPIISRLF